MMPSNNVRHRIRAFAARWLVPYLPYPHFMCVAPLDAVLRILWRAEGRIPPAYWPRLVLLLLFSGISTVASLPERVIVAAWLRLRPPLWSGTTPPCSSSATSDRGRRFCRTCWQPIRA